MRKVPKLDKSRERDARIAAKNRRELIAAGTRPIDDATYRDRDDQIQALRLRLPAVSLIR